MHAKPSAGGQPLRLGCDLQHSSGENCTRNGNAEREKEKQTARTQPPRECLVVNQPIYSYGPDLNPLPRTYINYPTPKPKKTASRGQLMMQMLQAMSRKMYVQGYRRGLQAHLTNRQQGRSAHTHTETAQAACGGWIVQNEGGRTAWTTSSRLVSARPC